MNINLRFATPEDKDFCRLVHHSAYRDVIVRQFGQWNEALQDSFFEREWNSLALQIVEIDGQSIGCFCSEEHTDHLSIMEINLLPQYQRQGIGTQLLVQQLDEARRLKLPVRLQVLRENRARELYERLGFKAYDKTETHLLMEWTTH
jgi:ribosomal protein S18 acetylase RimI-like enzyme